MRADELHAVFLARLGERDAAAAAYARALTTNTVERQFLEQQRAVLTPAKP